MSLIDKMHPSSLQNVEMRIEWNLFSVEHKLLSVIGYLANATYSGLK